MSHGNGGRADHPKPSTAWNPIATATSRNARKKQRSRARKEGGLLILRDHPSRYRATHNQVSNLIAKCLPRHCAPDFMKHFKLSVGKFTKEMESERRASETCVSADAGEGDVCVCGAVPGAVPPIDIVHDDDLVIKTPVKIIDSTLKKVFGGDFVSVMACDSHEDAYLQHLRGEILTSKIITKKNFEVTNIFTEVPEENHQILSFFK